MSKKNIHVKNVREESWERFKLEIERISGSEKPGFGQSISDALDYYCEHVLSKLARKEWGGGVKHTVKKREDKLKYLIDELINDLFLEYPYFWHVEIYEDYGLRKKYEKYVRYTITEKKLKKAITKILGVSERHTVRNYIDMLATVEMIYWDNSTQEYYLSGGWKRDPSDPNEIPPFHLVRKHRMELEGTEEYIQMRFAETATA